MTYIEFFDTSAPENICACLTQAPERVIFIGDSTRLMNKHIARYSGIFQDRGLNIDFSCRSVSKNDLHAATALLTELVETYDDCVFDVTGGSELLLVALGIVFARFPEKNIQIHMFNLRNNMIYDCDKDGETVFREIPALTVDENIRIFGGDVIYGDVEGGDTYDWDLSADFVRDAENIWRVCSCAPQLWNVQISMLAMVDALGIHSDDGLTVSASMAEVWDKMNLTHEPSSQIVDCLLSMGLLTRYDTGDQLTVSYKNMQVKRCLTKAGQALELKIYIAALLAKENGEHVYSDALTGVVIDWDGSFHDGDLEDSYDTKNEIDVLLMHNLVPVFISCKNGAVDMDELYKLNTVATRFGGKYAKKVLVATSIPEDTPAAKYLRQRADDMNIHILERVHEMDDAELQAEIKKLWKI